MMDASLLRCVKEDTPLLNTEIVDGLATKLMPKGEEFIDGIFRTAAKDFPPSLRYLGSERCTPEEEFRDEPRTKVSARFPVDIARSDIYMMKYRFSFEGEELPPRYIFLPFVGDAGSLMLSGARFFISPLLADVILSYEKDKIFIVFPRDKFAINRTPHSMRVNGQITEIAVPWAVIHHEKDHTASKSRDQPKIPLMHYLLGKYGFTEAFTRFVGCAPVWGTDLTMTEETYPASDWVIFESTRMLSKPYWGGTDVRLAVPVNVYEANKAVVRSWIAGFFFIADRFATRVKPEFKDSTRLWRTLMGEILWGDSKGQGVIYDDICNHFNSLDRYIDDLARPRLEHIGYPCEDIYEFLQTCIVHIDQWMLDSPKKSISLYGKELSVHWPVFMQFVVAIFKFDFAIITEQNKNGLTKKSVMQIMKDHLKPKMVFKIRQPNATPNVSNMSYSGDNKFFKITSVMVPQKGAGRGKDSKGESAVRMHVSIAEVGSFLNLPKTDPTGHARINPALHLDKSAYVRRDPEIIPLCDATQEILDRRMKTSVEGLEEGFDMDTLNDIKSD